MTVLNLRVRGSGGPSGWGPRAQAWAAAVPSGWTFGCPGRPATAALGSRPSTPRARAPGRAPEAPPEGAPGAALEAASGAGSGVRPAAASGALAGWRESGRVANSRIAVISAHAANDAIRRTAVMTPARSSSDSVARIFSSVVAAWTRVARTGPGRSWCAVPSWANPAPAMSPAVRLSEPFFGYLTGAVARRSRCRAALPPVTASGWTRPVRRSPYRTPATAPSPHRHRRPHEFPEETNTDKAEKEPGYFLNHTPGTRYQRDSRELPEPPWVPLSLGGEDWVMGKDLGHVRSNGRGATAGGRTAAGGAW
jgi:hypothetical protein